MTDYELATCKVLIEDFLTISPIEWDIEGTYNFWKTYSNYMNSEWVDYIQGHISDLVEVIEFMYDTGFRQ